MDRIKLIAAIAALSACAGCASVVDGRGQPMAVQTTLGGWPVAGVSCTLTNSKGTWTVTTPATTHILRAHDPLTITCDKPGVSTGTLTVLSRVKGLAFGNLIVGGVPGAITDVTTGNAFDYPDTVNVRMGMEATAALRQSLLPQRYWLHSDPVTPQ
jgi:hypothetical protein